MERCKNCGKELTFNEVGATRKFLGRNRTEFLCRECLAEALKVPPELIDEKIEQFKKQGCLLFVL